MTPMENLELLVFRASGTLEGHKEGSIIFYYDQGNNKNRQSRQNKVPD